MITCLAPLQTRLWPAAVEVPEAVTSAWRVEFSLAAGRGGLTRVLEAFRDPGLSYVAVTREPATAGKLCAARECRYELTTRPSARAQILAALRTINPSPESVQVFSCLSERRG
ncbi:MAG TPA: hypothetical protein VGM03_16535 [Phycisphaerae bacterium]|jgi:hypothetical protein